MGIVKIKKYICDACEGEILNSRCMNKVKYKCMNEWVYHYRYDLCDSCLKEFIKICGERTREKIRSDKESE